MRIPALIVAALVAAVALWLLMAVVFDSVSSAPGGPSGARRVGQATDC